MINGAHTILYATDADKARAFFKDVLGFPSVDAGRGWLIFALPPSEIAVHPLEHGLESGHCEIYFMCDDIKKTVEELTAKGVEFTQPVSEQPWGLLTMLQVPGGGEIGIYEPKHPKPPHN